MVNMSIPIIDKVTVLNVVAAFIVLAYVVFMIIYPSASPPAGLVQLANIAIGYLFTSGGITIGQKLAQKSQ